MKDKKINENSFLNSLNEQYNCRCELESIENNISPLSIWSDLLQKYINMIILLN